MSTPAALPMYDLPELRPHTDALWAAIRTALADVGVEADKALDRITPPPTLWANPALGFAQTCGLPYVRALRGKVTLIGTPDYGIIPEKPGWYNSAIIVREKDARAQLADYAGAAFAYNDANSQSGLYAIMHMLHTGFGDGRFFGKCQMSGAHVLSVQAVLEERADIAAIDAVTWRYAQKFMPETERLRVLATTMPSPGLPYISRAGQKAAPLAAAVERAIKGLAPAHRQALGIKGLWHADRDDYNLIAKRAAQSATVISAHIKA
jgi:ABC-type phosphate/phosphonate transport system substrate-binding protein